MRKSSDTASCQMYLQDLYASVIYVLLCPQQCFQCGFEKEIL